MESSNNSTVASSEGGSRIAFIAYISGEAIIAFLTAFGNRFVIAAIIKHPRLQTSTNYFVASLAAADFLVGVLGIPCAVVSFVGLRQSYASCVFVNTMIIVLTQISVFGLCAVAVERFVAIKYPYKYADDCTLTLCLLTIIVVWLMGFLFGVVPLLIWDMSPTYDGRCSFVAVIDMRHVVYVNFFICMLTPLIFMFEIYCYIFYVVRQQLRRIATLHQVAADSNQTKKFKNDTKAAKWFAVVIILFAISWLPLNILNTMTLYGGPLCLPCLLAAIILSHANSLVNPILYAYANSKFKSAFKRMLHVKDIVNEDSITQVTRGDYIH